MTYGGTSRCLDNFLRKSFSIEYNTGVYRTGPSATRRRLFFHFVKVIVFRYLERLGVFQEFPPCIRHLQQTIVFHILGEISGNQCLADNRIPYLVFFAHSRTEHFEIFMQMRLHFRSFAALNDIYNIIGFEVLLDSENRFNHSTQ